MRAWAESTVGSVASGAAPYLARVAAACVPSSSGFDALLRWRDDNHRRPSLEVLWRGDLHPFNLLIDEHREMVVLDWTGATIPSTRVRHYP